MTFLQLQTRTMGRVGWTSTDRRTQTKEYLNERYHRIVTSMNLARLRRGLIDVIYASGVNTVIASGVSRLITLYDPTHRWVLRETTLDQIRHSDPSLATVGPPTHFAIYDHGEDNLTLFMWPQPSAIATVKADVITVAVDMSADGDVPNFPVDFHDCLIHGALADIYQQLNKPKQAAQEEGLFEKRLADLRFYVIKSNSLVTQQDQWAAYTRRYGLCAPGNYSV